MELHAKYVKVRDWVLRCLAHPRTEGYMPSDYWREEIEGFDYLFDASPMIVRKLREHCYHLTGIKSYEYRRHHSHAIPAFASKLRQLRDLDPADHFVPESPALGGFGHNIDGQYVNIDTLKFYESTLALVKSGVWERTRNAADGRPRILEIGAGWGGYAYQVKTLLPGARYMILDLPQTLLFSATYISCTFPQANCVLWEPDTADGLDESFSTADFIFVPAHLFPEVRKLSLDLSVNMVSFQEMTTEQVTAYTSKLAALKCSTLYSHNRPCSPHNTQLTAVPDIISTCYKTETIHLLKTSYTQLDSAKTPKPKLMSRNILWHLFTPRPKAKPGKSGPYQHVLGMLP